MSIIRWVILRHREGLNSDVLSDEEEEIRQRDSGPPEPESQKDTEITAATKLEKTDQSSEKTDVSTEKTDQSLAPETKSSQTVTKSPRKGEINIQPPGVLYYKHPRITRKLGSRLY